MLGSRCAKAGGGRHAGAGRLRRLPDAGPDPRRPHRQRERPAADSAGAGSAAHPDRNGDPFAKRHSIGNQIHQHRQAVCHT